MDGRWHGQPRQQHTHSPRLAAASAPQRMNLASVDHLRCRARNTTSENMTGLPCGRSGPERGLSLAAIDSRFPGLMGTIGPCPSARAGWLELIDREGQRGMVPGMWLINCRLGREGTGHGTQNMHLSAVSEHSFSQHEAQHATKQRRTTYHPVRCI